MAERTAVTQSLQKGYPLLADILTALNAVGIEAPAKGNIHFTEEFWKSLWGLVNYGAFAGAMGVYKESDTTYRVRGGSYAWGNTVKTYTQEAAVDPTDNDTTYIWMASDNTIGAAIDGTGWPGTDHIKLAEIDVDSDGVITEIRDLRGQEFLRRLPDMPTGDVIGTSDTQTLTNKTIDGDDNTIQDLPLTSIKTDAANASKFLERDGSGIPQSGKAVPSGDVVGTSDTQTLTNKTIDGDDNTVQDLPLTSIKTDAANASKFLERDASGIPQSGKAVPSGNVVGTSDAQTLTNKTHDGVLMLTSLPTSDPTNAGQVWNDAGTLKISAG